MLPDLLSEAAEFLGRLYFREIVDWTTRTRAGRVIGCLAGAAILAFAVWGVGRLLGWW